MSEEGKKISEGRVSGWRYAGIWLTILAGMSVSLCLTGRSHLVLSPAAPVVLTLGCGSLLGMSAICAWGLVFIVPMCCLFHAWLQRAEAWWRLLPAAAILMAMLSTVGMTMVGLKLPMEEPKGLLETPPEPTEEALNQSYQLTVDAWQQCGRVCLILLAVLVLHLVLIYGWKRTCSGIRSYWQAIRDHSRKLHEESAAEEAAKASAKKAAAEAAEKKETEPARKS